MLNGGRQGLTTVSRGDLMAIDLIPGPVISTLASRAWDARFARPVTMGGSQAAL